MVAISQQLKNFIKNNQQYISDGNWIDLFDAANYDLSKYDRCDLSLMLKDSGIPISIEDVFSKELGYTNYAEDDMLTSVSQSLLNDITKQLDWDYSNDLKGYPFNDVLEALANEYGPFVPQLKDYYREYKDDSSPVIEFRYILLKPGDSGVGSLIGFGFILKIKDGKYLKVATNGLRETLIDYREGFGIGYNKDKLNKYAEERFKQLLIRLG